MKRKTRYPDHPELLECVLQEIRDTPIEAYDARIARYDQETCTTEATRQNLMKSSPLLQEQLTDIGTKDC